MARPALAVTLGIASLGLCGAGWAQSLTAVRAASDGASRSVPMGVADARHLLGRVGFGPTFGEVDAYARLSRADAVERLLSDVKTSAGAPPPAWVNEPPTPPRSLREGSVEQRQAFQQQEIRRGLELRAWWIGEMLAGPSPLTERMTLFWHNHFTSSQQKVRFVHLMYRQNLLLREKALGNFADLLHAVSKDPAMVIYLDNASNRRDRPNENFAREVMELFTLGEGNYSETDIREAARAFTGWSIDPDTGSFRWRPFIHDSGEKTVLGQKGNFNGDAVLDILLEQPQTAQTVVGKLWREFVAPDFNREDDRGEVNRIARVFRDSRYDIRTTLRELLLSQAFWAEDNRAALVKSPVDFVVGTLRQFDVRVSDAMPFALVTAGLGQNLFSPPNVKGWPGGEAWINSATLLSRKQFVERLFRGDEMRRTDAGMSMSASGEAQGEARRDASGQGQGQGTAQAQLRQAQFRARMSRAVDETRFDGERWFRKLEDGATLAGNKGSGNAVRDLSLERFVLASAPVNPVPAGVAGRERLRLLTLDPVYQLK